MTVYKARAKFKKHTPKFKIFYENGTTYDEKTGLLDRAHKQGVVAILMESGRGQRLEKDCEFYCYYPHGWVGVAQYGLYDYLATPGFKLVLFGRNVNEGKYRAILHSAQNDNHIKG